MALATYSELQASIANWLRRADLTAAIPDFVSLAEAQINRRVRVRRMVARATATLTDEYSAVPGDFAGVRTFDISGTPIHALQYLSNDQFLALKSRTSACGPTAYYTVVGGEFRFMPVPTAAVMAELTYWQAIPALSDTNTTNWLLTMSPDIYLYGALLQSAPYLRADPRIETWSSLYLAALDDLQNADKFDETGAVLTPIPTIVV